MTATERAAPAGPTWHDGWYRFARHVKSPNFGPRPDNSQVDVLLIHSISLPPEEYGGPYVEQLFTNTLDWSAHPYFETIRGAEVSAHFFIRRDGQLWQFVSCNARAWHAGKSNLNGRDNVNDFSIGVELEGIEDGKFEAAQYETLSSLATAIAIEYPIAHVAGHEHVAPGRKKDPGKNFDWPLLRQSLGWENKCFP